MWRSYVAMGDSFTEGLDDPYPGGGRYRGWADLVAARLAQDLPGFHYANLAVRGKLFIPIAAEQVPVGRELRPDLFSFAAAWYFTPSDDTMICTPRSSATRARSTPASLRSSVRARSMNER